jgi:hypothetical protein
MHRRERETTHIQASIRRRRRRWRMAQRRMAKKITDMKWMEVSRSAC